MNMEELSDWLNSNTGENLAFNLADAVTRAKMDTLAEIQRLDTVWMVTGCGSVNPSRTLACPTNLVKE